MDREKILHELKEIAQIEKMLKEKYNKLFERINGVLDIVGVELSGHESNGEQSD